MKHERSTRELWMIALAPGLAILAIDAWFVESRATSKNDETLAKIEKTRASAPPPVELVQLSARVASLRDDLAAVRKERTAIEARRNELTVRTRAGAGQAAAVERLAGLVGRHGLTVVEEGREQAAPSPAARVLAGAIEGLSAGRPGETHLWRVRFVGRYLDVLAMLEELAGWDVLVVPVAVQMEEAKAGVELRTWTVVFWL